MVTTTRRRFLVLSGMAILAGAGRAEANVFQPRSTDASAPYLYWRAVHRHLRQLRQDVTEFGDTQSAVKRLGQIRTYASAAQLVEAPKERDLPIAERPAFRAQYREAMGRFVAETQALEIRLRDGDTDNVVDAVLDLIELKDRIENRFIR